VATGPRERLQDVSSLSLLILESLLLLCIAAAACWAGVKGRLWWRRRKDHGDVRDEDEDDHRAGDDHHQELKAVCQHQAAARTKDRAPRERADRLESRLEFLRKGRQLCTGPSASYSRLACQAAVDDGPSDEEREVDKEEGTEIMTMWEERSKEDVEEVNDVVDLVAPTVIMVDAKRGAPRNDMD